MTFDQSLPLIFMALMGLSMLVYVISDGYDLGVGLLMPRANASHTSSTASGRMANCGSITPLMISVASTDCFSRVSATCTSTNPRGRGAAPCRSSGTDRGHTPRSE